MLVAVSIKLDRIEEGFLYKAQDGSCWLSCVCVFGTDAKNRTVVVQSIPPERYKAGERGPQVGHWREIGGASKPSQSGKAAFDLSRYKKPPAPGQEPISSGQFPPATDGPLFPQDNL